MMMNRTQQKQKTLKQKRDDGHEQEILYQSKDTHSIVSHTNQGYDNEPYNLVENGTLAVSGDTSSKDLKVKLDSMMEHFDNGDYKWKCTVCEKASTTRRNMRNHIETHIEGLSYPCEQCGKVSRSSSALAMHVSSYHRK